MKRVRDGEHEMDWFHRLVGFSEEGLSCEEIRSQFTSEHVVSECKSHHHQHEPSSSSRPADDVYGPIADVVLTSKANGRRMIAGRFEAVSLAQLRERVDVINSHSRTSTSCASTTCNTTSTSTCSKSSANINTVRELVGDIRTVLNDPANAGAMVQVASQFNCLEMIDPTSTPEMGIGVYEKDHTQGPICAMACGAGTIYRNYFVEVKGDVGQTADRQLDGIARLGAELGNNSPINAPDGRGSGSLWEMQNGYCQATKSGLATIRGILQGATEEEVDRLRGLLEVGIQYNAEVTSATSAASSSTNTTKHPLCLSQIFCSALPVAYARRGIAKHEWKDFAVLVLEAAYEATILAAVINREQTGCNKLYLTMLGGGAFGNTEKWINDSMRRALEKYRNFGLDICIVSYGKSNAYARQLVKLLANDDD